MTHDTLHADSACEELRAHGIKCSSLDPNPPGLQLGPSFTGATDSAIQVVVAPEDEARAKKILNAWLRKL